MTFARLRAADWVAFLAALALLFATAVDRYSTKAGEQARELERSVLGFDAVTTVQLGAPLALGVLGGIALACAIPMRAEEQGTELREVKPAA